MTPTVRPVTGLSAVVADNVRAERARRRLSQAELADRLGWAPSAVSQLEQRRRDVSLGDAVALCRALGVPLAVLVAGDTEARDTLGL